VNVGQQLATEKRAESDFRMIEPDSLRPEAHLDDFGLGGVLPGMTDERVKAKLRHESATQFTVMNDGIERV
jgi:hypothetical protein